MHIFSQNLVKTRKPHHCPGCARVLPAGAMMYAVHWADGGECGTDHWCRPCQAVIDELRLEPDEVPVAGEAREYGDGLWDAKRLELEGPRGSEAVVAKSATTGGVT